jgi:hypothetical protein
MRHFLESDCEAFAGVQMQGVFGVCLQVLKEFDREPLFGVQLRSISG